MRLFVANFPLDVDESELRECFRQYGECGRVVVVRDGMRASKGYGFVDMTHDRDALLAAQELTGQDWDGRRLRVEPAHPIAPRKQPA